MVWMAKSGRSVFLMTLAAVVLVAGPWRAPASTLEAGEAPPAVDGAATQAPAADVGTADGEGEGEIDQLGLAAVTLLLLSLIAAYNRNGPRHRGGCHRGHGHYPAHAYTDRL